MAISAVDFVRIVTRVPSQAQSVSGQRVEGVVEIYNTPILISDWSDCKFDSSVRIRNSSASKDLDLRGTVVEGSLTIEDFTFSGGGLLASSLHCAGSLELRSVRDSHADASVALMNDGADEIRQFLGLNLNSIRVAGNLDVAKCSSRYSGSICLDFAEISGYARIEHETTSRAWLTVSFASIKGLFMVTIRSTPVQAEDGKSDGLFLFDGLTCGSSFSLSLSGCIKRIRATKMSTGGSLKIIGVDSAMVDDLGISGANAGDRILLTQLKINGDLDCSNCAAGELELHQLDIRGKLDVSGSAVSGDIAIGDGADRDIKAKEIDLYQVKARNLWLNGLAIGCSPEQSGVGALDISRVMVGTVLSVENVISHEIRVRYSNIAAVQFKRVRAGKLDAKGIAVETYVQMEAVTFDTAIFDNANIGEELFVFNKKPDDRTRFKLAKAKKAWEEGLPDQNVRASMNALAADNIVSRFERINIRNSKLGSINLEHAFFPCDPHWDQNSASYIDCRGTTISGSFKVRQMQFPVLPSTGYDEKSLWTGATLLDIRGSRIGEMDLGEPLPGLINLKGSFVESWGIADEDPKKYDEILGENVPELDGGSYLRVENQLENAGQRERADQLHVLWRDQESKNFRGLKAVRSRLHRSTIRYGTDSFRVLKMWFACLVVSMLMLSIVYKNDVQISTGLLADIKECGAACYGRSIPQLSNTVVGITFDSLQMALRDGVPIVDLGLASHLEARNGTLGAWVLILIRIIGWITWPLFLASAVASFFPKRHRA